MIARLLCAVIGHRWRVVHIGARTWRVGDPACGNVACRRCDQVRAVFTTAARWRWLGSRRWVPWRLDDQLEGAWYAERMRQQVLYPQANRSE